MVTELSLGPYHTSVFLFAPDAVSGAVVESVRVIHSKSCDELTSELAVCVRPGVAVRHHQSLPRENSPAAVPRNEYVILLP
jgi:hypothetical protein